MTKIEAGKTYRTKNGLSVRILATNVKSENPIVGAIMNASGSETTFFWRKDGSVFASSKNDLDLIIPTERRSRWLNWYDIGLGESDFNHSSRENADKNSGTGRTHVLEIITENRKPVDVKIHEVEG